MSLALAAFITASSSPTTWAETAETQDSRFVWGQNIPQPEPLMLTPTQGMSQSNFQVKVFNMSMSLRGQTALKLNLYRRTQIQVKVKSYRSPNTWNLVTQC